MKEGKMKFLKANRLDKQPARCFFCSTASCELGFVDTNKKTFNKNTAEPRANIYICGECSQELVRCLGLINHRQGTEALAEVDKLKNEIKDLKDNIEQTVMSKVEDLSNIFYSDVVSSVKNKINSEEEKPKPKRGRPAKS